MFNLKMFDAVTYSAVDGKKIVILLRVLSDAATAVAALSLSARRIPRIFLPILTRRSPRTARSGRPGPLP